MRTSTFTCENMTPYKLVLVDTFIISKLIVVTFVTPFNHNIHNDDDLMYIFILHQYVFLNVTFCIEYNLVQRIMKRKKSESLIGKRSKEYNGESHPMQVKM
jgi:hypothetical protein